MSFLLAKSLKPPAIASAWSDRHLARCIGIVPGLVDFAHHVEHRRQRVSTTITVTTGLVMYSLSEVDDRVAQLGRRSGPSAARRR